MARAKREFQIGLKFCRILRRRAFAEEFLLSGGSGYFRPFFFGRPGVLFLLLEGKCRLFLGKGRLFAFFVFWNAVFTREIPLSSPCKVRGRIYGK